MRRLAGVLVAAALLVGSGTLTAYASARPMELTPSAGRSIPTPLLPRLAPLRPPVACAVPAAGMSLGPRTDPCLLTPGPPVRRGPDRPGWCLRQVLFLGDPHLPTCPWAPVPQRPEALPAR